MRVEGKLLCSLRHRLKLVTPEATKVTVWVKPDKINCGFDQCGSIPCCQVFLANRSLVQLARGAQPCNLKIHLSAKARFGSIGQRKP